MAAVERRRRLLRIEGRAQQRLLGSILRMPSGTTRRSYLSGGTNSGASSPESLAKKLPNGAYADNHVGNLYIGPKYCRRGVISEEPQHAQIEAPDDDKN
jgi:hypothetical protein